MVSAVFAGMQIKIKVHRMIVGLPATPSVGDQCLGPEDRRSLCAQEPTPLVLCSFCGTTTRIDLSALSQQRPQTGLRAKMRLGGCGIRQRRRRNVISAAVQHDAWKPDNRMR